MTKLETEAGFEDMLQSPHVDLLPCQAFQLEALDKREDQGVLTIDGEALRNDETGSQVKIYGEVVEQFLPVMYG